MATDVTVIRRARVRVREGVKGWMGYRDGRVEGWRDGWGGRVEGWRGGGMEFGVYDKGRGEGTTRDDPGTTQNCFPDRMKKCA